MEETRARRGETGDSANNFSSLVVSLLWEVVCMEDHLARRSTVPWWCPRGITVPYQSRGSFHYESWRYLTGPGHQITTIPGSPSPRLILVPPPPQGYHSAFRHSLLPTTTTTCLPRPSSPHRRLLSLVSHSLLSTASYWRNAEGMILQGARTLLRSRLLALGYDY